MSFRRREVLRIEAFSDAVFGFALTLLIVALEVPSTFSELMNIMRGFVPFAFTFATVVWVWYAHYVFFSRFGMEDPLTVVLNGVLLFVVLFYVYPLKFMWTVFIGGLQGKGWAIGLNDLSTAFAIYGLGFVALFLALTLLYGHAYRSRTALGLTTIEIFDAQAGMREHLLTAAVALLSVLIAVTVPAWLVPFAGSAYFLLGPVLGVNGYVMEKRRKKLERSD